MEKLKAMWAALKERLKPSNDEIPPEIPQHEHDHSPVMEADPYSWEVSHKRVVFLLRLAVGVIVVMGAIILNQNETMETMAESYEPKVVLLREMEKSDKLYRIEPFTEEMDGFEAFVEGKAKRYVRLMLEIDEVTQTERFKEAFRMTDMDYYKRFKKDRIDSGAIRSFLNENGVRSITVESIEKIDTKGRVFKYVVDFIQTDKFPGKRPDVKEARAYVSLTTRPQEVSEIDKYENPFGVTVLDMALKEKRKK
ncbi:VirB8/TrbF family protein [Terasakiella sp. SH-1]|uniref:VirB8/TrbF family protein n=1 Tax=Terasakiella sp. SH-1 TaxID=2560057 RepID=UPI0010743AD0|nr:VirB8/TrbF family protein [Terasakiella sp. SH-1]